MSYIFSVVAVAGLWWYASKKGITQGVWIGLLAVGGVALIAL